MDVKNAQVLDFLVGGSLVSSGGSLMQEKYNISDDITNYSVEQWAELHDRSVKAQWFLDNFEEIKSKFETVINGQIKFRQFQGWLYDKGFKGASKGLLESLYAIPPTANAAAVPSPVNVLFQPSSNSVCRSVLNTITGTGSGWRARRRTAISALIIVSAFSRTRDCRGSVGCVEM